MQIAPRRSEAEETPIDQWEAQRGFSRGGTARPTCHERARKKLPLVEFAHSIFDVLPQQAPFVGRHMTIATTLIKIGGNCSAQHDV
jgi:hypothetical protein